jgi:hypothetical protein
VAAHAATFPRGMRKRASAAIFLPRAPFFRVCWSFAWAPARAKLAGFCRPPFTASVGDALSSYFEAHQVNSGHLFLVIQQISCDYHTVLGVVYFSAKGYIILHTRNLAVHLMYWADAGDQEAMAVRARWGDEGDAGSSPSRHTCRLQAPGLATATLRNVYEQLP